MRHYIEGLQTCPHGIYGGYVGGECDACDDYEYSVGGTDKCLNCGRYVAGNRLTEFQTCKGGCHNPNEY